MNMATVTSDDPLATKDPSAAGDMLHSTRDRSEDCDPLSLSGGHLDRRFSLQALLSHQMERRILLDDKLRKAKETLDKERSEVRRLEVLLSRKEKRKKKIEKKRSSNHKADLEKSNQTLKKEVSLLQLECDRMVYEVTELTGGTVPLGETSLEFYESLKSTDPPVTDGVDVPSPNCPLPGRRPSRPAPPPPSGPPEGPQWSCSECTFLNHPALDRCEECEMPRITDSALSTSLPSPHQQQPCFCHPHGMHQARPMRPAPSVPLGQRPSPVRPQGVNYVVVPSTVMSTTGGNTTLPTTTHNRGNVVANIFSRRRKRNEEVYLELAPPATNPMAARDVQSPSSTVAMPPSSSRGATP